mmetsp:Transcript_15509/g.27200  ORF Transcript_15509/g.27200 Transcript_15509/m.27200 type:complete len:228 (-) Transcript_15509:31-714(-)
MCSVQAGLEPFARATGRSTKWHSSGCKPEPCSYAEPEPCCSTAPEPCCCFTKSEPCCPPGVTAGRATTGTATAGSPHAAKLADQARLGHSVAHHCYLCNAGLHLLGDHDHHAGLAAVTWEALSSECSLSADQARLGFSASEHGGCSCLCLRSDDREDLGGTARHFESCRHAWSEEVSANPDLRLVQLPDSIGAAAPLAAGPRHSASEAGTSYQGLLCISGSHRFHRD